MGRKSIPNERKNKAIGISFSPEDRELLKNLEKSLGIDKSKIIRYLLRCASTEGNQSLRNLIVNLYQMERMTNNNHLAPLGEEAYRTKVKFFTTIGETKTASKEDLEAVDQRNQYKEQMAYWQEMYERECDLLRRAGQYNLIDTFEDFMMREIENDDQLPKEKFEMPKPRRI